MSEKAPGGESLESRLEVDSSGTDTIERTCVIIKSHALEYFQLIRSIYERAGFRPTRWRVLTPKRWAARRHYHEHRKAAHYPKTVDSLCGQIVAMEFVGPNVISRIRELNGATNPAEADPGTIRYIFGGELPLNAVHASSDPKAAELELDFWFDRAKVIDTTPGKDLPEQLMTPPKRRRGLQESIVLSTDEQRELLETGHG